MISEAYDRSEKAYSEKAYNERHRIPTPTPKGSERFDTNIEHSVLTVDAALEMLERNLTAWSESQQVMISRIDNVLGMACEVEESPKHFLAGSPLAQRIYNSAVLADGMFRQSVDTVERINL